MSRTTQTLETMQAVKTQIQALQNVDCNIEQINTIENACIIDYLGQIALSAACIADALQEMNAREALKEVKV